MLIVMLSLASAFSDLLVPAGAVVGTSVIIEICRAPDALHVGRRKPDRIVARISQVSPIGQLANQFAPRIAPDCVGLALSFEMLQGTL